MSTLFGKSKRRRSKQGSHDHKSERGVESSASVETDVGFQTETKRQDISTGVASIVSTFEDLGLAQPLVTTCRSLGFSKPTPVQRTLIPFLLREQSSHLLCLASTGSGKTAAFVLPALHRLASDPYGIFAVVLTPTRELAKQIHQQVLALGSAYRVQSALVVGGLDAVRQSCELDKRPHFCVATPGRLAELLRGPCPPKLKHVRYLVLDEADRLLASKSGFERDVAELLLHITTTPKSTNGTDDNDKELPQRRGECQTLLFSATRTRSLESIEEMAGAGLGRLPLQKFVIKEDGESEKKTSRKKQKRDDSDELSDQNGEGIQESSSDDDKASAIPRIPAGLKQEYMFMPSRVRDAYLLAAIRALLTNGGRRGGNDHGGGPSGSGWMIQNLENDDEQEEGTARKARSAIVFVSTCERAAMVSGILTEVGVENVALHSLLSQNRRLAALGKFKSQHVRILVATDVASRGLDIPTVDLVLNSELPRRSVDYVHRVGRTARAGRRGRAISFVAETDVGLVHATERMSGRPLEKCTEVTDDMALKMLGPVTKAARLAKMKLMDMGFDELVKKMKERKARDRKERERIERALRKLEAQT